MAHNFGQSFYIKLGQLLTLRPGQLINLWMSQCLLLKWLGSFRVLNVRKHHCTTWHPNELSPVLWSQWTQRKSVSIPSKIGFGQTSLYDRSHLGQSKPRHSHALHGFVILWMVPSPMHLLTELLRKGLSPWFSSPRSDGLVEIFWLVFRKRERQSASASLSWPYLLVQTKRWKYLSAQDWMASS